MLWSQQTHLDPLSSCVLFSSVQSLSHVQLFVTPMDYAAHGIPQARILELGSCSLLQGIFPIQGSTPGLHITGGFFTNWAIREAQGETDDLNPWKFWPVQKDTTWSCVTTSLCLRCLSWSPPTASPALSSTEREITICRVSLWTSLWEP